MERLRCFVAMRFGERQTDKVYDKLIRPTLKQEGLLPIRIDRVEHNDNIDARIIHEIGGCELALADLTFARPSVYFEAGYAQRKVPVIYTCRKDHFTPKPKDKFGNFRVHFDLQMKNIIAWSNEKDSRFAKKLRARIKKVVRPILLEKARLARDKESQLQFSRLSMESRLFTISKTLHDQFKSAGFRPIQYDGRNDHYWLRKTTREFTIICNWQGESFSKKDLRKEFYRIIQDLRDSRSIAEQLQKPTRTAVHWIVCTLNRTPPSRVHGAVGHFAQDQSTPSLYVLQNEAVWMVRVPMKFSLHTIDSIRSEDDFSERLKATLVAI